MADKKELSRVITTAVSSLATTTPSAVATGFPEVVDASVDTQYVIIQHFYPVEKAEHVSKK